VRSLEQEALLRVDMGGFARGNAEEFCIELIDVVQEAPAAR